jgi:hypothetical protein
MALLRQGGQSSEYAELVSLSQSNCWTWTALRAWLSKASLVALVAAGLVWGPLIADRAWDQGAHVTPAQAALHSALLAGGFAHHHGGPTPGATSRATGVGFQAGGAGTTWGTPLTQALQAAATLCPSLALCPIPPLADHLSRDAIVPPLSPPPERS